MYKIFILLACISLGAIAEPPVGPQGGYQQGGPQGGYQQGGPQGGYQQGGLQGGYQQGGQNGGSFNGYDNADGEEPANYEFKYDVEDQQYGVKFGHQENRQGDVAVGSYYVLLPDGRTQHVEYQADQDGYKPKITYEEAQGGYPSGGPAGQNAYPTNGPGGNGGYQFKK